MKISIARDSVAAGDDCIPLDFHIEISEDSTIKDLIKETRKNVVLPQIKGGKATWIIKIGTEEKQKNIGVIAQQWNKPRYLIPPKSTIKSIFFDTEPNLKFIYWCQANPIEVLEALQKNKKLPNRYS